MGVFVGPPSNVGKKRLKRTEREREENITQEQGLRREKINFN